MSVMPSAFSVAALVMMNRLIRLENPMPRQVFEPDAAAQASSGASINRWATGSARSSSASCEDRQGLGR
jgi:hypothetical protein